MFFVLIHLSTFTFTTPFYLMSSKNEITVLAVTLEEMSKIVMTTNIKTANGILASR